MSLLAFRYLETAQDRVFRRPRWRYGAAVVASLLVAWAMILWSMTFATFESQSTISELGSYVLFVGAFAWLTWFRYSGKVARSLVLMGIWALASLAVNRLTKHGLPGHFLAAGVAGEPRLYLGLLFVIPPVLLLWRARDDAALQTHGFAQRHLGLQVVAGLLAGAIISLHFFTTIKFSGVLGINPKPLPYLAWSFGYECFQSLSEELFFRGVVLRGLQQIFMLNFWPAMALTTALNLSIFLIKSVWQTPLELAGLVVYLTMISVAACILFRRFQSVIPGWIANVVFSLFAVIR